MTEKISPLRLLMVDDDAVMRHLVKTWSKDNVHCLAASTPNQALEALQESPWDVFFVDLNLDKHLADGDGLSLVEAARLLHPDAACVLITAHGKQEEFSSAVNLGIDQILIKPFSKQTFFATLKKLQDIRQTREALKEARVVLEQQNKELQRRRLHEQKLASLAQKYLLFSLPKESTPGLAIHGASQAQEGASGDLVDIVATHRGVNVVSGDVMGKGLGAAIVSAGIKISLSQLRHLQNSAGPAQVLTSLREKVTPLLTESESLLTLSMSDINTELGMLELVDCGAPHLLLQRGCDGHILFVAGSMMPMGITEEPVISTLIPILENDRLLLVSDGILDAFGLPLAHEAYSRVADIMAEYLIGQEAQLVIQLVHQPCAPMGVEDDRSCVALHYTAVNPPQRIVRAKSFPTALHSLPSIRHWAQETVVTCLPKSEQSSQELWLQHMAFGLAEIASNVIGHACQDQAEPKDTQLLIIMDPEGLWLEWHYKGSAFTPPERHARHMPRPETLAQSGYGLSIIDAVFERVHYFTSIPYSQSIVAFKPWPN